VLLLKNPEPFVLTILLSGIFTFILGIALYVYQLMERYSVEWQVQLAFFGFILILLALIVSKILWKVRYFG
jgi:membrane-bound ClpP family serine protease